MGRLAIVRAKYRVLFYIFSNNKRTTARRRSTRNMSICSSKRELNLMNVISFMKQFDFADTSSLRDENLKCIASSTNTSSRGDDTAPHLSFYPECLGRQTFQEIASCSNTSSPGENTRDLSIGKSFVPTLMPSAIAQGARRNVKSARDSDGYRD